MAAQPFTASRRILGITAIAFVCVAALGGAATASAAPRNDSFGNAATLRVGKAVKGTINGATNQHGEPRHANSLATHSVWYKLRARSRVGVLLGTCSANFDSVVAVYTGRRLSGLREVDFNNDGCGRSSGGSRVSFTAKRGKTYYIAVAGFAASGRFRLTVDRIFTPLNDDLADARGADPRLGAEREHPQRHTRAARAGSRGQSTAHRLVQAGSAGGRSGDRQRVQRQLPDR